MNRRHQLHRILEQLEDRVLFDAVPDGGFIVQVDEAPEVAQNQQVQQVAAATEDATEPRELIVIDSNVDNADQLLSAILESRGDRLFEVHMLSTDQPGIDQISALLEGSDHPYDAVHVISHGNVGGLQLGNDWVNADTLSAYAGQISGWANSLTADADLMFYGCNLGASSAGQEFIEMMSALSGADVAASTDVTGHESLGGDWSLEARFGEIEAQALSAESYTGVLIVTDAGFVIGTNPNFGTINETAVVPESQAGTSSRMYTNAATAGGGAISIDVRLTLVNTYDENGNLTTGTANQMPVTFSDFSGGPVILARTPGSSVNGFEGHTADIRIEYFDSVSGLPLSVVGEFTVKDIDYEPPTMNGSGSERIVVNGSELDLYETSISPATDINVTPNGDGTITFDNTTSRGGAADEERWVNLVFEDLLSVTMNFTARNANTGYGLSTDSFSVTPTSNFVPDATDDNFSTSVGTSVTGNVVTADNGNGVDSDPDGDALTVTHINANAGNVGNAVTGSAGGTFTINSDGTFTFNPGSDFDDLALGETRDTTVTYTVNDGKGLDDMATVTVTVTGVNDDPVTVGSVPAQTSNDGDTISPLDISSFFSDPDTSDSLTYSAGGTLPPGLVLDPNTGIISGTIDNSASQSGPFSVIIVADDGNGGTISQSFAWTVNNPGPSATDNDLGANENQSLAGNVVTDNDGNGVDSDPDNDSLSVVAVNGVAGNVGNSVTGSTGGQFTINGDGSYGFDPGNDFDYLAAGGTVTTTVTYTISDGEGGFDTATVSVLVTGTNDAPTAAGTIPAQSGADNTVAAPLDVSGFFVDVDNPTLTFSAGGTLPPGLSIDPVTGIISGTYDPSASTGGPYNVVITANDGDGGTVQQSFTWTVTNPAPTASNDDFTTTESAALSGNVITDNNGNGVDSDPDGDSLSVAAIEGSPANVGVAVAGSAGGQFTINSDGSFSFDPGTDFETLPVGTSVTTTVTYTVSDGEGGTDTATVSVTVDGENDDPTATPVADQSSQDSDVISLDVSSNFNDIDGDTLSFSATGLPPGLSIDPVSGVISGTIDSSASAGGPYSVMVTVDDGNGGTVSDTFSWDVSNPGPTATNDTDSTDQDTVLSGDLLANDSDPDGDALTVTEVGNLMGTSPLNVGVPYAGTAGGLFTVNSDGTYTFDPNGDFDYLALGESVDTVITYEIEDADGAFDVATVVITVTGTNDDPAAVGTIPGQSNDDSDNTSVDVSGFFTDTDLSDTLTYSSSGLPTGLTIDPVTGEISGTIDSSASQGGVGGVYSVTITATDDHGQSVDQTFSWTVTNPAPIANDDNFTINEDSLFSGTVTSNDSDPDGDSLTYTQLTSPANGTLGFNPDGSFTYTPNGDFNGTDTFTYQITDADGTTATATVTI
ncbi:MAG: Ig-like domain-containing protein, partial [Pirellulaceae bacterium]